MSTTSLILSLTIGGAGLGATIFITIKAFLDTKKSVQDKIDKRRQNWHSELTIK